MGVQGVVLEDHRDIAVLGRNIVDKLAVDVELTLRDFFQTCDHTQRRRFAAAGRTDEDDKFLVGNVEVEFLHRNDALVGDLKVCLLLDGLVVLLLFALLFLFSADKRIDLFDIYQFDFCHRF